MAEKYTLSAHVTVSAYTVVEADSLEEAIKAAGDREVEIGDCRNGVDPSQHWVISDADGEPFNVRADD